MQATYHNKRDNKGRFTPISKMVAQTTKSRRIVNHIAVVFDRSGSMAGVWNEAITALNNQIRTMKDQSTQTGQVTKFTLVGLGDYATKLCGNQPINEAKEYSTASLHNLNQGTALNDAINMAIAILQETPIDHHNDDNSYAVIVITDGENNRNNHLTTGVHNRITDLQNGGLWTFAVNCPTGYKNSIYMRYGVPLGNINEWENTVQGTQTMGFQNSVGTQSYYTSRSLGQTQVSNYFDVNADNFNIKHGRDLTTVKPKHGKIEKEIGIQEFFSGKGITYWEGMAYYELTKAEKVQDYKKLIVLNVNTGVYSSDGPNFSVRDFLGMPTQGTTKVDPKNVGFYRIFVQSTSTNRKLVRGSTVLWL